MTAQGAAPDLDGMVGCDVLCPTPSPFIDGTLGPREVCVVRVHTYGMAPSVEEVDGWWLVRTDDGDTWVSDGSFTAGPFGTWRSRGPDTVFAPPLTPIPCDAIEDVLAFGWKHVDPGDPDMSAVGVVLVEDSPLRLAPSGPSTAGTKRLWTLSQSVKSLISGTGSSDCRALSTRTPYRHAGSWKFTMTLCDPGA